MTQDYCTGPEDDLGIWFSPSVEDRAEPGCPNKDCTQVSLSSVPAFQAWEEGAGPPILDPSTVPGRE